MPNQHQGWVRGTSIYFHFPPVTQFCHPAAKKRGLAFVVGIDKGLLQSKKDGQLLPWSWPPSRNSGMSLGGTSTKNKGDVPRGHGKCGIK
jgi:hypothetical protein